jgi:predicted transcriptional regulator of viral defense system
MDEFARRWASLMRLAARRMGLFTVEDAVTHGVARQSLVNRVNDGRLLRLFPGVYTVAGAPDSWERRALAAQLAGGPHAVL